LRGRERERRKRFFGGRPIGRPETNSGSGQLRIFFGQLEADHGVKLEHRGDKRVIWTSQIPKVNLAKIG
jgi:hypothetical protein